MKTNFSKNTRFAVSNSGGGGMTRCPSTGSLVSIEVLQNLLDKSVVSTQSYRSGRNVGSHDSQKSAFSGRSMSCNDLDNLSRTYSPHRSLSGASSDELPAEGGEEGWRPLRNLAKLPIFKRVSERSDSWNLFSRSDESTNNLKAQAANGAGRRASLIDNALEEYAASKGGFEFTTEPLHYFETNEMPLDMGDEDGLQEGRGSFQQSQSYGELLLRGFNGELQNELIDGNDPKSLREGNRKQRSKRRSGELRSCNNSCYSAKKLSGSDNDNIRSLRRSVSLKSCRSVSSSSTSSVSDEVDRQPERRSKSNNHRSLGGSLSSKSFHSEASASTSSVSEGGYEILDRRWKIPSVNVA